MQLLPSMRDTIDRMTRPPSRVGSKPAFSTPNFSLPPDADSVWPVAAEQTFNPSSPKPRTPLLPRQDSTPKHSSEESFSSFNQHSTPKPHQSVLKPTLKSALRSPNPKAKPENSDNIVSPSNGVTLKSVKSLLRRKSSAADHLGVEEKQPAKTTKPIESFTVVRTPQGRSRSRTDPGTRPASTSPPASHIPLPATPQPPASAKPFASNIPRLRSKTPTAQTNLTDDSDIEYRYELEARRRRRLTVTNAKIPLCSSSSESETDSVVLSPTVEHAIGLGIRGVRLPEDVCTMDQDESKVPQVSVVSYPSAGSIYTDEEESEESQLECLESGRSVSLDTLDVNHSRRREALLGLVRGLDLNRAPGNAAPSGDESEYHGEDGVAVTGSGVEVEEQQEIESESEYEVEVEAEQRYLRPPTAEVQRSLTPTSFERSGVRPLSIRQQHLLPSSTPSTPRLPSSPRLAVAEPPKRSASSKAVARMSLPPVPNARTKPTPSISKRKSLYSSSAAVPPAPVIPEPPLPTPARDSSLNYESVMIAKRSREAVVRGREALGIPPSESDQTTAIPHVESVVSDVGVDSWDNGGNDELSVGAKALFRTLSSGGDGKEHLSRASRGMEHVHSAIPDNKHNERRKSKNRSRSRTRSPNSGRSRKDEATPQPNDQPQAHGTWQSTVSPSAYIALSTKHGELEMARQEVIWNLYHSEISYTNQLATLVRLFVLPLRMQNTREWIPGVPLEIAKLFDWLEDIHGLHVQIRDCLQEKTSQRGVVVDRISGCLCGFLHKLEVYQPYMVKVAGVVEMLKRLREDEASDFGEFVRMQEKEQGNLCLVAELEEPMKRLKNYAATFNKLLDTTPKSHEDYLSTVILVRSMDLVNKILNEVKAREDEYKYVKTIAQHIDGLPAHTPLASRERRLLCQETLYLVNDDHLVTSSPDPSARTARLANAVQEWNVNRTRSGSNASTATYASTLSTNNTMQSDVLKSPLTQRYSKAKLSDNCLNFPESTPNSTLIHLPVEVFLFSDLIVLATARSAKGSGREAQWTLMEEFGMGRVLDFSVQGSTLTVDIIPIRADLQERFFIKTLSFNIPEDNDKSPSDTRKKWTGCLSRSSYSTLRAFMDPYLGGTAIGGGRSTVESESRWIIESIVATGLPFPKSPSMQMEGDAAVQLEREERDHAETLADLPDEYLRDIGPVVKKIALSTGVEAYNIVQNNGKLAFQHVPHVHFHVIPKPNETEGLVLTEIGWHPSRLAQLKERAFDFPLAIYGKKRVSSRVGPLFDLVGVALLRLQCCRVLPLHLHPREEIISGHSEVYGHPHHTFDASVRERTPLNHPCSRNIDRFMAATGHMGVNIARLVEGYVKAPTRAATIAYFLNLTVSSNIAKQFLLVIVNLFSDMLLTWRVYLIWQRNWMITLIPAFLCVGAFVCGIVTGVYESLFEPGQSIFLSKISSWATSQFSLSLAMNVTTTILIASRIWYVTKGVREMTPEYMKPYWRIIVIVVESASVAAVAQIIQLAFYVQKFPGIYFISDTIVQIVAMAPLIIIVLVGMSGSRKSVVWGTAYTTSEEVSDMQFQARDHLELSSKSRRRRSAFASRDTETATEDDEFQMKGEPTV
ncbi:hypothetical protein VNI00_011446 [Paramarasmius palmivorus]|uniref:DH domain-containing protein n=1 Tax=Paramarasmius palmivorus TaxID=297713 RepID=A0AAW0CF09_9AGAR